MQILFMMPKVMKKLGCNQKIKSDELSDFSIKLLDFGNES